MPATRTRPSDKNNGVVYERAVKNIIRKVTTNRPTFMRRNTGSGAFSSHDTDMTLNISGNDYPIEIKYDMRAQMGGISIAYDYTSKKFQICDGADLDDDTADIIYEFMNSKIGEIDYTIRWFMENDGVFVYNRSPGFPLRVSQDAWSRAVELGVILDLNDSIQYTTEFINRHYRTKGVDYMQIGGGAGLFCLGDNPLGLDVPRLSGDINLEFRAGKSGEKYNKTHDYTYSTVILRLQGRLTFRGTSNMTLDTEDGAKKIIEFVEEKEEEHDCI